MSAQSMMPFTVDAANSDEEKIANITGCEEAAIHRRAVAGTGVGSPSRSGKHKRDRTGKGTPRALVVFGAMMIICLSLWSLDSMRITTSNLKSGGSVFDKSQPSAHQLKVQDPDPQDGQPDPKLPDSTQTKVEPKPLSQAIEQNEHSEHKLLRHTTQQNASCLVQQPKTRRVALLLTGEALRGNQRQGNRIACGPHTEDSQRKIALNQLEHIVAPIEQHGYEVDIFGVTYPCSNGTSLNSFLRSAYQDRFNGLNADFPKSNEQFGAQIHSLRAVSEMVMDHIDAGREKPYEQLLFFRWDILAVTPFNTSCTLKNPVIVARDNSNIHGLQTLEGSGKFNIDWFFMIPGALLPCFVKLARERPKECCSTRCMGPACRDCMNVLNEYAELDQRLAPTTCAMDSFIHGRGSPQPKDELPTLFKRKFCDENGVWVYEDMNGTIARVGSNGIE